MRQSGTERVGESERDRARETIYNDDDDDDKLRSIFTVADNNIFYNMASVSSTANVCAGDAGFWRQRAPAARRGGEGGDTAAAAAGDR